MGKRISLRQRALRSEGTLEYAKCYERGFRANRISAAERRVVEAALLAAKHCRKYGTAPLDELMAEVEKLERAKGGDNG